MGSDPDLVLFFFLVGSRSDKFQAGFELLLFRHSLNLSLTHSGEERETERVNQIFYITLWTQKNGIKLNISQPLPFKFHKTKSPNILLCLDKKKTSCELRAPSVGSTRNSGAPLRRNCAKRSLLLRKTRSIARQTSAITESRTGEIGHLIDLKKYQHCLNKVNQVRSRIIPTGSIPGFSIHDTNLTTE